jgi:hypothetical protein
MTPMRATMVGPLCSTTMSIASTAAYHSGSCCSAFGSFCIYLAASSRVTSGGRGGAESDRRSAGAILFRASMTPALFVEFGSKTFRRPRCRFIVARVAARGRAHRRHRICRRARLPMAEQDGSRRPSRGPRTESILWLAQLARTFATNLPHVRFGHASGSDPSGLVRPGACRPYSPRAGPLRVTSMRRRHHAGGFFLRFPG